MRFAFFARRSLEIHRDAHGLCPLSYSRGCVLENQVLRSDARTQVLFSLVPRSLTVPGAPGTNWTSALPVLCLTLSLSSCLENQMLQIFVGFFFFSHLNNNCEYIKVILLKNTTAVRNMPWLILLNTANTLDSE